MENLSLGKIKKSINEVRTSLLNENDNNIDQKINSLQRSILSEIEAEEYKQNLTSDLYKTSGRSDIKVIQDLQNCFYEIASMKLIKDITEEQIVA